ncbi:MAG TPA: hypothetical protein VIH61_02845, partial [Waddliaceae bacterium]
VSDLNAIETRVAAWVSGCQPLLQVFEPRLGKPNGNDPYIDFATKLTGIPYEKLESDIKSKDKMVKKIAKDHRQMGKVGVLGCVYRLGGGGWGINPKTGDDVKTGMWGFAEGYGVQMEQSQAHHIVQIFREYALEIKQMWFDIEDAYADVLAGTRTKRELGPGGCVKFDKLTLNQQGEKRDILRIQLPDGSFLHYFDAKIEDKKKPWKDSDGNDVYGPTLTYSGVNQTSHQWQPGITSHGGKIFENIVQAIARGILAVKLLAIEAIGIQICGHVHDEGIGETADCPFQPGVQEMIEIMSQPVSWAPGLLLGADGFEGSYYHK